MPLTGSVSPSQSAGSQYGHVRRLSGRVMILHRQMTSWVKRKQLVNSQSY